MTPLSLAILIALGLSAAMVFAWAVAVRSDQSGWIDAIWTFAVGLAGLAASLMPIADIDGVGPRRWVVAGFCAVWSLRLGSHIVARTRRHGDDPRYARMREEWGGDFRRKLFWLLQVQAAAALILVVSIAIGARRPLPDLTLTDIL